MIDVDWLYYLAKCVLGFSQKEAWRLTPRQIAGLLRQHNRYNGGAEPPEDDDERD